MTASEGDQFVEMDSNNNFPNSMKGYSLRPRTLRRSNQLDTRADPEVRRPPRSKRRHTPGLLSKYRRKTANARERGRMREINEAFEALRRVIPQVVVRECSSEKLTKITTLRLAMRYISVLDSLLLGSGDETVYSPSAPPHLFIPILTPDRELLGGCPGAAPPPADSCLVTSDPLFTHSSYVFDETPFLMDFT